MIRQFVTRGILLKKDKVLFITDPTTDFYFIPGGRIEEGEGAKKALIREIKEELGKDCTIIKHVGTIEHEFIYNGEKIYEINNFFLINIDKIDTKKNPPSAEAQFRFEWIKISDLDNKTIYPESVKKLIKEIKAQKITSFFESDMN